MRRHLQTTKPYKQLKQKSSPESCWRKVLWFSFYIAVSKFCNFFQNLFSWTFFYALFPIKVSYERATKKIQENKPKSKLENKLLIPTSNFWKMCKRGQFHACRKLPFVTLVAYSNVSKIKISLICFF